MKSSTRTAAEAIAAFLQPPQRLLTVTATPELGRVSLQETTVLFRTAPRRRLSFWLRRIDQWVADANSVVEE
jgi:hypothetical protein